VAEPEPRTENAWREASVSWPVITVLLVSGVLLGGATAQSSWWVAVSVVAVGIWSVFSGRFVPTHLGFACALLAAFSLLQSLPTPEVALRWVAPASAAFWRESDALWGESPALGTVTLEPSATRLEALRLLCYCIFAGLCHHVSLRTGSRWLCACVALAATLLGLATVVHQVVDAERVFGWYQPQYSAFVAPLMNPNNLSGAMNLGFFCAAGLVVDVRTSEGLQRLATFACLVCMATGVWLGSRAGVALLFLAAVAWVIWEGTRLRGENPALIPKRLLPVALGVGLGTVFAALSTVRLRRELFDDSLDKLSVVSPALAAAWDHFPLGAGRGAFAVAVSPFETTSDAQFEHAENFLLGWAVEWGWPVAIASLLALGYWLWPRRLGRLSPPRAGAYIGLCTLWIHNLVDLSLDVPFVAFSALAAASAFGGARQGSRLLRRVTPWLGRSALVGIVALLAAGFFAPLELARAARHRIAEAAAKGPVERSELLATARAHPADPYLLRLVAADALARRDPATLRWLGLALERGPGSGHTLLLLADALAMSGHLAQATSTLRQVLVLNPELADEAARRAFVWSPEDFRSIVPAGPHALSTLNALVRVAKEPAVQLELAREAAELPDAPPSVRIVLLKLMLTATDEACARALASPCRPAAQKLRAELDATRFPELFEVDAALLASDGQIERASNLLEAQCPRSSVGTACLLAWLRLGHDLPLARQLAAAEALLAAVCADPSRCPYAELDVADALRARGEPGLALSHLRRAADSLRRPELWQRTAELARDTRNLTMLQEAIGELARLGQTPSPELLEAEEALRRAKLTSE
jgi:hypothetical protein